MSLEEQIKELNEWSLKQRESEQKIKCRVVYKYDDYGQTFTSSEYFNSKEEAEEWIKKNGEGLLSFEIRI